MKAALLFAAAFAITTSAALAQTVTPGTTPGTQTSSAPTTTDQATHNGRVDIMPNMSRSDKKSMRKEKKMKSSDGTMKMKAKM